MLQPTSASGPRSTDRRHWEQLGASYGESWEPPAKQLLSARELDFIGRHLRESAATEALDVGIGSGRVLASLLDQTADTTFHGIDLAQAMVDECRDRFADEARVAGLARCDVAHEPIPFDQRFGFISAIRVLKYSPTWADVVGALADRLEPGGRLVFSMPNRISLNRFSKPYAVPWYTTTPSELRERCGVRGLSILELRAFPRLPYVAYRRAQGLALKGLVAAEGAMDWCCGDTFGGREIFVAATRA